MGGCRTYPHDISDKVKSRQLWATISRPSPRHRGHVCQISGHVSCEVTPGFHWHAACASQVLNSGRDKTMLPFMFNSSC
eukprot:scaffold261043_cov21-Prasinocladus_malaysianus.AAC.2